MFDVNTMNGSRVTAKMAGIESTAKMTSVTSTRISAMSSGVATRRPFSIVRKREPSNRDVDGITRRASRRTRPSSGRCRWLRWRKSLIPVTMRKAPNT